VVSSMSKEPPVLARPENTSLLSHWGSFSSPNVVNNPG
jgi:hypothetical protein